MLIFFFNFMLTSYMMNWEDVNPPIMREREREMYKCQGREGGREGCDVKEDGMGWISFSYLNPHMIHLKVWAWDVKTKYIKKKPHHFTLSCDGDGLAWILPCNGKQISSCLRKPKIHLTQLILLNDDHPHSHILYCTLCNSFINTWTN